MLEISYNPDYILKDIEIKHEIEWPVNHARLKKYRDYRTR